MADTTIWEEISKIKNPRRRIYFMWKNGLENIRIDYGAMSKEEFVEYCSKNWMGGKITSPDEFFNYMEKWESTAEYKRLLFLCKEDKFANDLIEIYEGTREKALEGDSQAIKNVIMLQKEIKKYRKSIDKFQELEEKEEEDDGLTVSI